MAAIRVFTRWLWRFLILWLVDAVSLLVTTALLPGIYFQSSTNGILVDAAAAALMLGIVNLLIRPLVLLLTLPLGALVTFVIGFVANALALMLTSRLLPSFHVDGFISALLGGIILAAVNTVLTGVLSVDDEDSFYQGVVERLARRRALRGAAEPGRGIVMLEIDGLSYWHIQKALEQGKLPTLKRMMDEDGYVLSRVDCGLPSQTSACQAGIMFGDNHDIPAFRWYDKDQGKLFVSGKDASAINARYARGNGLMRGGSSINNMLNGDAEKSLLTLADLRTGSSEEKNIRARDVYLLVVNPYFLMRTIVLMFGDALLEVWQYWRDRQRDVQPRLNRLHGFYPFVRAACVTFMRDVASYLVCLDIIRGSPSIYTTWPGYDEVAHHTGPWTPAAFNVLERYDGTVARVRDMIRRKAPRPYDLFILSDHGQSFGATFAQRYGYTLKEFIERNLPQGTTVTQAVGGDTGVTSMAAVSGELDNVADQGVGGRVGKAVVKQGQRAAERAAATGDGAEPVKPAQVVAYGSGNQAQVYFDLYPRRITLDELEAAYPGMVDALVQHEAIGFVAGYSDPQTPVVLGKRGRRNLCTGEVEGEDPLQPYGDPVFRAAQVRRVMDFPHAGDLMVNSTVFPDGTVAALEELIGSHGGMGGEQMDAFLFHPGDMQVPQTSNSADLFALLNARRGLPAPAEKPAPTAPELREVDVWAPANLARGFRQPSVFLGRALRAMILDRSAYRAVVEDPYMTGPGLLIGVLGVLVTSVLYARGFVFTTFLGELVAWVIAVLVLFGAARLLGGRASYTTTLRAVGFADATRVLALFSLIPDWGSVIRILVVLVSFFAVWIAAVEAQQLTRWRGLLLPIVSVTLYTVAVLVLSALAAGAAITFQSLAQGLGL